jgi:hypothetical protein
VPYPHSPSKKIRTNTNDPRYFSGCIELFALQPKWYWFQWHTEFEAWAATRSASQEKTIHPDSSSWSLHLAQVIKMALDETPASTSHPEKKFVRPDDAYDAKAILTTAAVVVGGSIALWTVFRTFLRPGESNVK